MEEKNDETTENNILYELLIYAEWPQEPEVQICADFKGANLEESIEERAGLNGRSSMFYQPGVRNTSEQAFEKYPTGAHLKWLFPFASVVYPPNTIQNLVNMQMPWQFAVGEEGHVVAVLQDQSLEIRSFRDEYGSVIGRANIFRDMFPRWRKLVWSPDCTMLALCDSSGNIDVYDLIGSHLFRIDNPNPPATNNGKDFGEAAAGIIFSDLRVKNTQWSYELIIGNFRGKIRAYCVSLTDSYKEHHEFSLSNYYPSGISTFCYHPSSHTLLVCGEAPKLSIGDTSKNALKLGITSWRTLIGEPYYKLALALDEEKAIQKSSWWSSFPLTSRTTATQDTVYKLSISPNGDILAAIHTSGALSLWDLPALRLRKYLDLTLQPNYSDCNPQHCEPGVKRKTASLVSAAFCYHLHDINWWSNDALILARYSGAVFVSSIYSLKNLLGASPEWFEPSVQLSTSHNRGFLAMECERIITKKKRSASEIYDFRDEEDSSDDEDLSFFTRSTEMTKKAMFYITDNERFRPPRKKMKFLNKTYRLLCLKSTTPEELFTRKINNEEYGEALALAKTYGLDSDLVYQRQWRKTPATVASIQDYLSKITRRAWVLHECLERVPETIEATKELLLYGLRGTDLAGLIAIGKGEDPGRFILGDPCVEEYTDTCYDHYSPFDEIENRKQEMERARSELLKQVNFSKLTLEQKQLCQCRLKLLGYLDRLTTYEAVLGGPGMADEFYDCEFFKKFRCQSGFEACISFARNSNFQAIAAMFTYHGGETLIHRLPILSNFPETTSPVEYQSLLPKLGYSENGPILCTWNEDTWRKQDWCEIKFNKVPATPADDFTADFYEANKNIWKYRDKLTPKLVTEWFIERAHEIEQYSSLVDNALDLIKLGMERNIQGLERLLNNLKTLETLVYDCNLDNNMTLKDFEERDDFEIVQLLMSKSDENNIVKHVKSFLLPFLDRCERHLSGSKKTLLKRYLVNVSKDSLKFCRKIFESSRTDQQIDVLIPGEEHIAIALDCIYTCERNDCLKDICVIMDQLPSYHNSNSRNSTAEADKLQDRMKELEKHLRIAELFEKNGMAVTVGYVKQCSEDTIEIKKLLTKLTRFAGRRQPVLDETEWRNLLIDLLEIQKQLYPFLTSQDCYEIYLQSLLCSGRPETITLAGKKMECSKRSRRVRNTSGQSNLSYKLPYDNSVDLVIKASQEYFNSSSSPSDPCMTLAWSCLKLIEDESPEIEEECDLILSLKLLQEFNVASLPLQVRLCADRLTLVQRALANKINGYRNSQKLMRLAYLLRVCGDDKVREGSVLSLIAEAAFSAKDYEPCMNACHQLIEGGYKEGWNVCYKLGGCDEFSDIKAKCELMSFALIHCSADLLEDILKIRAKLQLQVIYNRVQFLMGEDFKLSFDISSDESPQSSESKSLEAEHDASALWQTGEKTLQVLQHTTKTTKAVLSSVGDTNFWKQAIKWIRPNQLSWEDNMVATDQQSNRGLNLQGTCAFYSGLIENAHVSELECNYQRYARPDLKPPVEVSSHLFRASLLEDNIKLDPSKSNFNVSVSIDLATAYLPEEIDVAFSYLMCLKKLSDVDAFFGNFPNTPVVLQLASLCFASKICAVVGILNSNPLEKQHYFDFSEITRKAEELMNSAEASELRGDPFIEEAFRLLSKYNKKSYDFIQAEILHSIGGGVDAARFSSDDVYKKETILGIAMTSDDSVFHIAVSLAHHYKLPLWEVYMAQLEYLFSDSGISAAVIEMRIKKLKLLDVLLKQSTTFKEKLKLCIWPNIDGKDHPKLQTYFTLLEHCGGEPEHRKLLKKFGAALKSLDYKLLMTPGPSSLAYLSALVNESNIFIFAKSASKIPSQLWLVQLDLSCSYTINCDGFLNSSIVYAIWAKKFFFEGSGSNPKVPQVTSEWLNRFDACGDILTRLKPTDFLDFINHIVFLEKSLKKLTLEGRSEIVKRALKFSRQKNAKDENSETDSQWGTVVTCLQQYKQHLQRMDDPMLIRLQNSPDPKVVSYVQEFDLSQSDPEKLKNLLIKIVIEGPDLQLLMNILGCCPANIEWEPGSAYIEAINLLVDKIRATESDSSGVFRQGLTIKTMENVLLDISKNRDKLLIDDIAVDILYSFCQDTVVPVTVRLQVLKILEKTNYFIKEYSNLLLLYQTQVFVASIWPDDERTEKLSEDDVKDELQRYNLFNKLISSSMTLEHFTCLAELLCHWPAFGSLYDENDENTPWTVVLCRLAVLPDKKGLDKAISFFDAAHSKGSLSPQACCKIFHEIVKQGSILHILKFAFRTVYEDLHNSAISILKQRENITTSDFDEELLDLVLRRHLVVQIVSTKLYQPVIEYLLNIQEEKGCVNDCYLASTVIKELHEAQFTVEAGSLLLITSQSHPGLSTFSAAFGIVEKWLMK